MFDPDDRLNHLGRDSSRRPHHGGRFVQWLSAAAAAFAGLVTLGMINQNLAHEVGSDGKELRATLALNFTLVHEP